MRNNSSVFGSFKCLLRQLLPPIFITAADKTLFRNRYVLFKSGFNSWSEAEKACEGYDADTIIDKVYQAAKLVFDGKAVYERDSCVFDEIHYSWPLLASLLLAAANGRVLNVVDFGGALGTTFQQNRRFLNRLPNGCRWRIVEQKKFVDIGQRDFSNRILSFYNSIEEAAKDGVDLVLFSGSICYVPNPYEYIDKAIASNANYIVFDRMPIVDGDRDTYSVQYVPPSIYSASYPIRNFCYSNIVKPFDDQYELVEQWVCDLQPDPQTTAMGFLFKRK